jgi:hypothetical protein
MKRRILASVAALGFALGAGSGALAVQPINPDAGPENRGALIADIVQSLQGRIDLQALSADEQKNWPRRTAAKLTRLNNAQLDMARRATSLDDLELLFITAPISNGTSLEALASSLPGDITIVAPTAAAKVGDAKTNPVASPASYAGLVFTAVQPCRIYDSRFSTAPRDGLSAGTPWAANSTRIVDVGPDAGGYAFQGGQAVNCAGTLAAPATIAAAMTAVSTVNQGGAGYLVFYSSGGTNPNPYGVAQWFQPGYVQTSFVVMPTDLVSNVWSVGFIGNASSHVIVDLVGYFSRSSSDMWAVVDGAAGTLARGYLTALSTPVTRYGSGTYQVVFQGDVSSCAYTATLGDIAAGTTAPGEITLASRSGNANAVFVETYTSAGVLSDRDFHLRVKC